MINPNHSNSLRILDSIVGLIPKSLLAWGNVRPPVSPSNRIPISFLDIERNIKIRPLKGHSRPKGIDRMHN